MGVFLSGHIFECVYFVGAQQIEVAKICEYFDGKSPQDSQEFLTTILENLHGSLKTKAQDGTAEEVMSLDTGHAVMM